MHEARTPPEPSQLDMQGPSVYHTHATGASLANGRARDAVAGAMDEGQVPTAVEAVLSISVHVKPKVWWV